MSKKIKEIKNFVETSDTLTDDEKGKILEIINGTSPWYVKVLEIIKYIGAIAGFILAGIGANACTTFLNI